MWVTIVARRNLGTDQEPRLGVKLLHDGVLFMPGSGTVLKSPAGRYRARRKPKYQDFIELVCLDVVGGPPGDILEVEPEEDDDEETKVE